MAKKMCKCAICGKEFDRNAVQAVRHGARRYSHWTCEPNGELVPMENKIDPELDKLNNYIIKLLGENYNAARVKKQIKDFKEQGMSYSGMLKSLIYFYEVKGNSKDKANGGIGIIPYIYKDAFNYYKAIFIAKQTNETKINIVNYKTKEITIKPPEIKIKKRIFDLSDIEEEDDEE